MGRLTQTLAFLNSEQEDGFSHITIPQKPRKPHNCTTEQLAKFLKEDEEYRNNDYIRCKILYKANKKKN